MMGTGTKSPLTRRAVLSAAIGGAAAAAAASVTTIGRVDAATGDHLVLGQQNAAGGPTRLSAGGFNAAGFSVTGSKAPYPSIFGASDAGTGVSAQSTTGAALTAHSNQGHAIRTGRGRIKVDQVSGVATVKRGRKSVTVKLDTDINGDTFVLLTPMTNLRGRDLWFTKSPSKDSITIRISRPRGGPTKIAWLALERG